MEVVGENKAPQPEKVWKFSEILADPETRNRWEKVRQYFFLRESTYDMTHRCNIRCEGCYYYEGEKQFAPENRDPEAWRTLMTEEKARGITFVVLAGAEPSLVSELCQACYEVIPLGAVATNGLKVIPGAVGYKIHVSVWGNDASSMQTRGAANMLQRQIENYGDDPRAVFVYTFTRRNIDQAPQVLSTLARRRCKVTFNMFSAPVGYNGGLRHTKASLERTRNVMMDLLDQYPDNLLFSPYNAVATHPSARASSPLCLSLSPDESIHGHGAGPFLPPVPHRPKLGSGGRVLRARHRLPGLPPLCRRKRGGHGPVVPSCRRSRNLPGVA